jgi:hypothetical protein
MSNGDIAVWTSIAAGAAAILASAITAIVTYLVTRRSVQSSEAMSAAERTHEVDQAWSDREQSRKLDAYVALARHVGHWTRQIGWAVDRGSFETDPPTPQPKEDSVDYTSEALISLVGSDAVWDAIKSFNADVMKYLVSVGTARTMQEFVSEFEPTSQAAAGQALSSAQDAGRTAIATGNSLIDLMRSELRAKGSSGR